MEKLGEPSTATQQKLHSLLIDKVDNGFIVHEDYSTNPRKIKTRSTLKKVYQTKKALTNYINQAF